MPVNLRAKMEISDRMKEAMRRAPEIMAEELTEGMKEVSFMRDAVKDQIQAQSLVKKGDLLKSVKALVYTNKDRTNVRGIVLVGTRGRGPGFYAPVQERGGTIKPRKGPFMYIPTGELVTITHVQQKSGDWRELKRPKKEYINGGVLRVRQVVIKPQWYFFRGVKRSLPHVEMALNRHGYQGMQRVFGEDGVSGG